MINGQSRRFLLAAAAVALFTTEAAVPAQAAPLPVSSKQVVAAEAPVANVHWRRYRRDNAGALVAGALALGTIGAIAAASRPAYDCCYDDFDYGYAPVTYGYGYPAYGYGYGYAYPYYRRRVVSYGYGWPYGYRRAFYPGRAYYARPYYARPHYGPPRYFAGAGYYPRAFRGPYGGIRPVAWGGRVGPAYGRGFGPGYGRGFGPAYGRGFGPGYGRGAGPGYGRGFGPGYGRGFGPGPGYGRLGHTPYIGAPTPLPQQR